VVGYDRNWGEGGGGWWGDVDVEERETDNGGDRGRVGDMRDIYTGVDGWAGGGGGNRRRNRKTRWSR
jgi:hypothetical protein